MLLLTTERVVKNGPQSNRMNAGISSKNGIKEQSLKANNLL